MVSKMVSKQVDKVRSGADKSQRRVSWVMGSRETLRWGAATLRTGWPGRDWVGNLGKAP